VINIDTFLTLLTLTQGMDPNNIQNTLKAYGIRNQTEKIQGIGNVCIEDLLIWANSNPKLTQDGYGRSI
jgi:hypothetical protein